MNWRPTATLSNLRRRAKALQTARNFFAERQVMEVETPAMVRHAVTDVNIHSAQVLLPGHTGTLFLHTSPEYAMKRLLAAGSGDIYQVAHVFRGDEESRQHNAEFTLIEWYRCAMTMQQLMQEVTALVSELLEQKEIRVEYVSYQQAFQTFADCDPLRASDAQLCALAVQHELEPSLAQRCQRDELLDWLMGAAVGPQLGTDGSLCFLHRYPVSQAALAKVDPDDSRVALRFELYCQGIELANGFEELTDPGEQRNRFETDRGERARRGLPAPAIDQELLAALASGLPPVSGVALGFDRVLMLLTGATDIRQVLAFPLDRA